MPAQGDGFIADLKTAGPDKDLDDNNAGVVLAACAEGELAWESSELQHGLFTYYLLQAMRGKADRHDNGGNSNNVEEIRA